MKHFKTGISAALITTLMLCGVPKYNFKQNYKKIVSYNRYTYSEDLDIYYDFLDEYANYIKGLNLSDIEIIFKLMSDIWYEIDGYGKPSETVIGIYNLSFMKEGVGVCTSFSDELANRLNKINWRYNARNIILDNIEGNKDITIEKVDIDRPYIETQNNSDIPTLEDSKHVATAVDLPDKNVTLVIDATNLMIGVLKNGKVYMFNTSGYFFDYDLEKNYKCTDSNLFEVLSCYFQSFTCSEDDISDLEEVYGVDCQKEATESIESIPRFPKKLSKILK